MNYGLFYKVVSFNQFSVRTVHSAIQNTNLEWNEGKLYNQTTAVKRQTDVAWINDRNFLSMLLRMVKQINRSARWNLNITGVEPVQFGSYGEGGFYDWHIDQHPKIIKGTVRKISMTLFLNDDFEGGEFDLEIYKPDTDPRYITVPLPKGSAVFFQGDQWHRVRPVSSGMRKSIVAWFYGPPYT